jgi:tetratricopeptide (TPR) repeat protein
MGSSRAAVWALAASLTQASLAAAQPKPLPQVQLKAAGDLVKKAIARSQAGDHVQAIELYQQAFLLIPQPILLSNIGAEYQLAQQPADAVVYFCKYLAAEPEGARPRQVRSAK